MTIELHRPDFCITGPRIFSAVIPITSREKPHFEDFDYFWILHARTELVFRNFGLDSPVPAEDLRTWVLIKPTQCFPDRFITRD